MGWLQSRQAIPLSALSEAEPEPEPSERATGGQSAGSAQAAGRGGLLAEQEVPRGARAAERAGRRGLRHRRRTKLDPTLILAIMAVESSFNPFAQSPVGRAGPDAGDDAHPRATSTRTWAAQLTAFDPVTNLRVGVKVLQECIARAGSVEGGLRYYVGAANLPDDGGYAGQGAGRTCAPAPGRRWARHARGAACAHAGHQRRAGTVRTGCAARGPGPRDGPPEHGRQSGDAVGILSGAIARASLPAGCLSATLARHATGDRRGALHGMRRR